MKIALIGYGKMGRAIEQIAKESVDSPAWPGHEISLIIDINNQDEMTVENLRKADVAIEFTTPDTAFENIKKCFEAGIPVVSGTTGWLDRYAEIENLCVEKNGVFFYASNFSIGVNIFFKINSILASVMNKTTGYDVTIGEVHHTAKKDAPSGTALTIAKGILDNFGGKKEWFLGTPAFTQQYDPSKLEITSQRRSVVPGIHTVTWESPVDLITLEHSIKDRKALASGAVLAAEFIQYKEPGIYSMDDLLDI